MSKEKTAEEYNQMFMDRIESNSPINASSLPMTQRFTKRMQEPGTFFTNEQIETISGSRSGIHVRVIDDRDMVCEPNSKKCYQVMFPTRGELTEEQKKEIIDSLKSALLKMYNIHQDR